MMLSLLLIGATLQSAPQPNHGRFCIAGPGVIFEQGSELDERSNAILDVVANTIKTSTPSPLIELRGHADTVGSRAANRRLGWRRAVIVRDALIRRGVPARQLVVSSAGEDELIRPTTDETAERLNHYVIIREIVSPTERARREDEARAHPSNLVC